MLTVKAFEKYESFSKCQGGHWDQSGVYYFFFNLSSTDCTRGKIIYTTRTIVITQGFDGYLRELECFLENSRKILDD